jgi:inner membrane protein
VDPLTQGTLGAALPQAAARRGDAAMALPCGFLAGMAPDLDVLIRSAEDPLLFLEYHRQFTHSLFFIPFGAALCAALLWLLWGRRRGWPATATYLYCVLGYATHALLDACTSYGTQLLWPFSSERFAWNNVSIIDPLLTLPLLAGVFAARRLQRRWPAVLGLAWVLAYLVLGLVARDAAIAMGRELAAGRGHEPAGIDAKPSFANLVLWKTVYSHRGRYYVDAVRILPAPRVYPGDSVAALDIDRDLPWLDHRSQQARDIERFRWFSAGYLALDPGNPARVIDLRYSLLPQEINPLWGIELNPQAPLTQHARYVVDRGDSERALPRLWAMIRGAGD